MQTAIQMERIAFRNAIVLACIEPGKSAIVNGFIVYRPELYSSSMYVAGYDLQVSANGIVYHYRAAV